ncbi:hypothetical protein BJ166DRAFT_320723 [Pestalotiopsis sp. NC0098]|nr:hypothetical protein BJ166DRAFT_320723 [Pestalotiopsis sp. NC0098]
MATECSSSGESRDLLATLSFKREEKFTRSLGYCLRFPIFGLINTVFGGEGYGIAESLSRPVSFISDSKFRWPYILFRGIVLFSARVQLMTDAYRFCLILQR